MNPDAAFFTVQEYASSKIRGEQIAERLGCQCNKPLDASNYPKHVVLVKCFPLEAKELVEAGVTLWADVVDTDGPLEQIAEIPQVNVIAISQSASSYLHARLRNNIVTIPEHHCNFENVQNKRWPPKVVGYIGYEDCFDLDFYKVGEALSEVGLEFWWFLVDDRTRHVDVVDFYKSIDIQVTFRGPRVCRFMPPEMKNPLKVINAASFGIPTVGYPEPSYAEFPPLYPVRSFEDLIIQCERLKTQQPFFRTDLLTSASSYHIENVLARYKEVLV